MAERVPIDEVGDNVIAALRPFSWLRADNYSLALNGLVSAFVDKVNFSHSLAQATAANQVSASLSDVEFKNQATAVFAGNQKYVSTLPAASWSFIHDGTGCDIFMVFKVTTSSNLQNFLCNNSSGGNGFLFREDSSNFRLFTINNAGGLTTDAVSPDSILTATRMEFSYVEGTNPEFSFQIDNQTKITGNSSTPPSAVAAPQTLFLGARASSTNYAYMRWADLIIFKRVLTPYERQNIQAYMKTRYGLI